MCSVTVAGGDDFSAPLDFLVVVLGAPQQLLPALGLYYALPGAAAQPEMYPSGPGPREPSGVGCHPPSLTGSRVETALIAGLEMN